MEGREESGGKKSKKEAQQGWGGGKRKARFNLKLKSAAGGSWRNGRTNWWDIHEQSKKAGQPDFPRVRKRLLHGLASDPCKDLHLKHGGVWGRKPPRKADCL